MEKAFERIFGNKFKTTFNGPVHHFLGLAFDVTKDTHNNVSIHLTQQAYIESLLDEYNLDGPSVNSTPTPYKSGIPIDSIPVENYPPSKQAAITSEYQHLVGSLQWLSVSTRPDLANVTNSLAKYLNNPSVGHLNQCKHVLRYLKGTIDKGICFTKHNQPTYSLTSNSQFPNPTLQVFSMQIGDHRTNLSNVI